MALEAEALLLQRAVRAKLLDPDKGTAALYIYSQLRLKGVTFSFGDFLVNQCLLTSMALSALEHSANASIKAVSTIGDYELQEVLGEGHNGVVFKALQRSLDRIVALKVLNAQVASDPASLKRFEKEARATARLTHPNIVMGIDVGHDQGLHYFAMEYVDGGSVRAVIDAAPGALPETTALNIVRQVAEGLKSAHASGMVHRDIKPDNILLTKDGQAKLADLGISQVMAGETDNPAEFWASPPYVAPEVIQGLLESDPRSDVYSLGITLYEMLVGHPPYQADTPEETMRMHLNTPVPDVRFGRPEVGDETAKLVAKMLEKNPDDRVLSASTLASMVARIISPKKVSFHMPRVVPPRPGAARHPTRHPARRPARDSQAARGRLRDRR